MSKLLKISCAILVLAILALLQTYLFETLPISKRFKIYRFEIGLLVSLVLIPSSNYIWRRFVKDISNVLPPGVLFTWKILIVLLLVLVHACPYTQLVILREPPFINILCWLSFGIYLSLLFMLGFIKLAVISLSRFIDPARLNKRRKIALSLFLTTCFVSIAYFIANHPPDVVR